METQGHLIGKVRSIQSGLGYHFKLNDILENVWGGVTFPRKSPLQQLLIYYLYIIEKYIRKKLFQCSFLILLQVSYLFVIVSFSHCHFFK